MGKSGDSFNKKERQKKKEKRRKDKAEKKQQRKDEGKYIEFMYVDADGNLTETKPDPSQKIDIPLEEIQVSTPKLSELTEEEPLEKEGFVKFFNLDKGYGFIIEQKTQSSFFVHANNLLNPIQDNDKVTFKTENGPKGPIAVEVKLMDESKKE